MKVLDESSCGMYFCFHPTSYTNAQLLWLQRHTSPANSVVVGTLGCQPPHCVAHCDRSNASIFLGQSYEPSAKDNCVHFLIEWPSQHHIHPVHQGQFKTIVSCSCDKIEDMLWCQTIGSSRWTVRKRAECSVHVITGDLYRRKAVIITVTACLSARW